MKMEAPFDGRRQHALDEIYERHGLCRKPQPIQPVIGLWAFIGGVLALSAGAYALLILMLSLPVVQWLMRWAR